MSLSEYIEDEDSYDLSWIKKEMYECRESAERKLSTIVHPKHLPEFLRILTTAWNCGDLDAQSLAEEFGICRKEFVAIERDIDLFMRMQLDEMFC